MANYVNTEKKKKYEGIGLLFYSNTKSWSDFDEYIAPPFIVRNYPFTFRNAGKSPL